MFVIKKSGARKTKIHLRASTILKTSDFRRIASALAMSPIKARKVGVVAARKAKRKVKVDTQWNGKETSNFARPGDWIVTSLTHSKRLLRDKHRNVNTYVIRPRTFAKLYEPLRGKNKFGKFFKSKSIVEAIYLSGGFEILAPWGQVETARAGYILLNGEEVYGNNAETFRATYEVID